MGKKTNISKKVFEVTGLSLAEYCTKFLHCNNKAFEHRARQRRLYPNEMIFLCWHLKVKAIELFGEGFLNNLMTQGQPGVNTVTEEVFKMYESDPSLINYLDSDFPQLPKEVKNNGLSFREVIKHEVEKEALEKVEEKLPEKESDDLFEEFKVVR